MLSDFLTKEKEWGEYYTKTQIKDGVEKSCPKQSEYKDTQLHIYALVYYYDSLVSTKLLLLFPAL